MQEKKHNFTLKNKKNTKKQDFFLILRRVYHIKNAIKKHKTATIKPGQPPEQAKNNYFIVIKT